MRSEFWDSRSRIDIGGRAGQPEVSTRSSSILTPAGVEICFAWKGAHDGSAAVSLPVCKAHPPGHMYVSLSEHRSVDCPKRGNSK
eukprot:2219415-Amphidinium_carterae.1